jgi:hypothetical protein
MLMLFARRGFFVFSSSYGTSRNTLVRVVLPPLFIFSSTFSYFFLVAAHRKKNPVALGFFSSSAAFTFPRTVAWHRFGVLEEHARGFQ